MIKDSVAVLDIGTSKVTAIIGENGVNGNFIIRSISEVPCTAFFDDQFVDETALRSAISQAIVSVCKTASVLLTEITVSVPSAFLKTVNREYEKSYPRRKRLRAKEVRQYYDEAWENFGLIFSDFEPIGRRGMFFNLDGNRRVEKILGEKTMTIRGYISYFFAKCDFVKVVGGVLRTLGINTVNYVPSALAEALLLFSSEERFSFRILLDVGYLTSEVSIIYGGALLYTTAFPIGGGVITARLCEEMRVDIELAERLKRRLNLSVPVDSEGTYELNWGEEIFTFAQKKCNDCARAVLSSLIESVDKAIIDSRVKLPRDAVIYLTGGGISFMRGAKEFVFNGIEMPVTIIEPKLVYMSKPNETSKLAILNFALNEKD
ncbi:MAG: hypothetical protein J6U25_02830 [Clostridia bacterium]|nr:hypothetical protein [Clostridia bacterium]